MLLKLQQVTSLKASELAPGFLTSAMEAAELGSKSRKCLFWKRRRAVAAGTKTIKLESKPRLHWSRTKRDYQCKIGGHMLSDLADSFGWDGIVR